MTDRPDSYTHLTFNAPLSDQRADALARRLAAASPTDVLDIGCGWGELLLRVLAAAPGATGRGIDTDDSVLSRARRAAAERGLDDRAHFEQLAGLEISGDADLVICVGSTHAYGEAPEALDALRALVRPGGRLLLGEGFWEPTGPVDLETVWPDMLALPDLAGLVDLATTAGFRPLWIETADDNEWHAFESGYLADVEEWLMANPGHESADRRRADNDEHRRRWLRGYRGGLGFAYLTLGVPRA